MRISKRDKRKRSKRNKREKELWESGKFKDWSSVWMHDANFRRIYLIENLKFQRQLRKYYRRTLSPRNTIKNHKPLETGVLIFECGPPIDHKCDHDGKTVEILSETGRLSGESASCSVCGMSSFDRSVWEGP